jgi:hypothetical protein
MTNMIDLANASPREVEKAVLSHVGEYSYEATWWHWRDENGNDGTEVAGLGKVTTVDSEGGSEGDGEYTHVVIKVTQGDVTRYFKKTGYYSSYGGSDWDGEIRSVWPATKTVTVYE